MVNPTNRPRIPAPPGHYGCPKCKTIKPVSEFYYSSRTPRGHSSYCKVCRRTKGKPKFTKPLGPKFYAKVRKMESGCWQWTGTLVQGYGQMNHGGKHIAAHHVALILVGRPLPDYSILEVVDHMCKKTDCVNPDHLRVVTQYQNSTENVDSPVARNANKTHCSRGHPLSGGNLALRTATSRTGRKYLNRICLTCVPHAWRGAVIPRDPPPTARLFRDEG